MVRNLGYEVSSCADGEEALRWIGEKERKVDLMVLDLVMPKLDGRAVFRESRRIRPGLRILLMSGFANVVADDLLREGALGCLAKPFGVEDLAREIQRCLGGAAQSGTRAEPSAAG